MIGLFFEVQTREGHRDQYLDLAAALKPALEATGGCLFDRAVQEPDAGKPAAVLSDLAGRGRAHGMAGPRPASQGAGARSRAGLCRLSHPYRPGDPRGTAGKAGLATGAAHALQRSRTSSANLRALGGIEERQPAGRDRMAAGRIRERLSRRPLRAPDRSAGSSIRHRSRGPIVCRSNDRVFSRSRGYARLHACTTAPRRRSIIRPLNGASPPEKSSENPLELVSVTVTQNNTEVCLCA